MKKILNNKKGEVVLRDLIIMLVIFSGVMALGSLFVLNMGGENSYDNSDMISEYQGGKIGTLGNNLLDSNLSGSVNVMRRNTIGNESTIGSFALVTGIIRGAAGILTEVLKAPSYIGYAVAGMFEAVGLVDDSVQNVIEIVINLIVYGVIIFVIISALLKGGRM